jgi:tetratricopeptide (TPR) repeat protein
MCLPLKVMSRIIVWALMASFLMVGLTFCQNTAEQSFTKGVEYAAEGDFERAKEEFERALKVDPTHEFAKRFLMLIEDIKEQEIRTKTAVPFFKGATYALKRQWTEAILEYNRAIEIEPNQAMPYLSRGKAYAQKGEYNQAGMRRPTTIGVLPITSESRTTRPSLILRRR